MLGTSCQGCAQLALADALQCDSAAAAAHAGSERAARSAQPGPEGSPVRCEAAASVGAAAALPDQQPACTPRSSSVSCVDGVVQMSTYPGSSPSRMPPDLSLQAGAPDPLATQAESDEMAAHLFSIISNCSRPAVPASQGEGGGRLSEPAVVPGQRHYDSSSVTPAWCGGGTPLPAATGAMLQPGNAEAHCGSAQPGGLAALCPDTLQSDAGLHPATNLPCARSNSSCLAATCSTGDSVIAGQRRCSEMTALDLAEPAPSPAASPPDGSSKPQASSSLKTENGHTCLSGLPELALAGSHHAQHVVCTHSSKLHAS